MNDHIVPYSRVYYPFVDVITPEPMFVNIMIWCYQEVHQTLLYIWIKSIGVINLSLKKKLKMVANTPYDSMNFLISVEKKLNILSSWLKNIETKKMNKEINHLTSYNEGRNLQK